MGFRRAGMMCEEIKKKDVGVLWCRGLRIWMCLGWIVGISVGDGSGAFLFSKRFWDLDCRQWSANGGRGLYVCNPRTSLSFLSYFPQVPPRPPLARTIPPPPSSLSPKAILLLLISPLSAKSPPWPPHLPFWHRLQPQTTRSCPMGPSRPFTTDTQHY